jgi:hypothetical protein
MPIFEVEHRGRKYEAAPSMQAAQAAISKPNFFAQSDAPKVIEFEGQRHEFPAGTTRCRVCEGTSRLQAATRARREAQDTPPGPAGAEAT